MAGRRPWQGSRWAGSAATGNEERQGGTGGLGRRAEERSGAGRGGGAAREAVEEGRPRASAGHGGGGRRGTTWHAVAGWARWVDASGRGRTCPMTAELNF